MWSRSDISVALVLALLALIGVFWAVPRETIPGEPGEIAPGALPSFALWTIFGCAVWQAVISLTGKVAASGSIDRFSLLFLGIGGLALLLAMAAIWGFGYVAGGILCILAIGVAMRPKGAAWVWLAVVAVGLPVAIYYLSWHGLRLSLP